ncbi:MAG: helix-turn-helix domain-containing protein [Thermoplasmata archaeon]|nr:helix-turn-helix domain-containing protein [Thermoplasmata archaeon]
MDELLEQPTRRRVVEDVSGHPGTSAREIQHRLSLGWGDTAYQLDRLTKAGAIRRERGGRRDYYFASEITWEDRKILRALNSPTQQALLLALAGSPSSSFAELQGKTSVSKSTVSFHLTVLLRQGTAETFQSAGSRRYRAPRAERVRELLRVHRESFGSRIVDRFAESFGGLSDSGTEPEG